LHCSKCNTEFDSAFCPNCGLKAGKEPMRGGDVLSFFMALTGTFLMGAFLIGEAYQEGIVSAGGVMLLSIIPLFFSASCIYLAIENSQGKLFPLSGAAGLTIFIGSVALMLAEADGCQMYIPVMLFSILSAIASVIVWYRS
jgi:hypothetical protein